MIKKLTFAKLANKWFVVLPDWEGDVEDLQMVCGADLMLEAISEGNYIVDISISDTPITKYESVYELEYISEDDVGADYIVTGKYYNGAIWLCNVTKHVLGGFLPYIYIIKT